jgi:hypothetical protein
MPGKSSKDLDSKLKITKKSEALYSAHTIFKNQGTWLGGSHL